MSSSGSEHDKGDDGNAAPGARDERLVDTQELPRVPSPPGFASDDRGAIDLWNEVTPLDAGPSQEAKHVEPRTASALARLGFQGAFAAPLVVARRTGRAPSQAAALGGGAMVPAPRRSSVAPAPPPERRYPRMRALLKDSSEVPHGIDPVAARPRPPPVPGTFFPAPRKDKDPPRVHAVPADLDQMLATMAEGLLVGEDTSGQTEIRVTLRDEFFAGTELRITAGRGMVSAVLVPPDRGTYLALNANIDELRERLEARGLQVMELRVAEP